MDKSSSQGKTNVLFLVILGALFLTLGLLNLRDRVRWNDPFDGIVWIERDQGVMVDHLSEEGATPDIHPGDILLRINQHEILNIGEYTDVLYLLRPGDTAHYVLKDRGTGDVKTVPVTIQQKPIMSIKDFYRLVVAFVYLVIGALILLRHWRVRGSIHFYLVCLFSFSLYLYSYTNRLSFLDYLVYWISVSSLLLLPPLFLHFCLNFPTRQRWAKGNVLTILYIYVPFALLMVVQILWFTGRLAAFGLPRNLTARIFLDNLHIIYFTLYFIGSLVILFHNRISLGSPELRQQMKWIVTGTTVAIVPFFFLYVLPFLMNLEITPLMQASILSLAFLPLSFAYAIMKYRLMDVDIIFKSGAAYFIASAVVLGLYFLLIGLSGLIFQYIFPGSNNLAVALSALVVAFLFTPIRRRVQEEIDRFFYKEEYKYRQSLIEFGQTLSTESSLKTLTSTIIDRVNKSLNVKTIAIFLRLPTEPETYELVAHIGLSNLPARPVHFKIPERFLIRGLEVPTLAGQFFENGESDWLYSLNEFYEKLSLHYFQPLVHRNEQIGVIALGKGPEGTFLSSEDLELLGMLSGYAAIALENAKLYTSLQNKARELELLKAYSENIIEGINVGVVAVNNSGTITTWNQTMEELYGMESLRATGKRFTDVFPADVYASILRALGRDSFVTDRTMQIYKLFLENLRGEKKFVNLTLSPFQDSSGMTIGTLLVFDDISSKVNLENQLLQAEKLSSLGLIAAGVAHEVNTPLTGISSFTQLLVHEVPPEHPHHRILKKIETQCFRASEIVNNLLNFARIQTADFKDVQVNRLLEESLSLLEHQFRKKSVQVVRELDPHLPMIRANQGRLMQVFINILLNAQDAVPEGGRVVLRTRVEEASVLIQIEDNGQGIPSEIIHRIYDPFFTTKDTGKGTGLGLSVSYGIIQEHSGRIFVDSRPGEGTCFTIKLPSRVSVRLGMPGHEAQPQPERPAGAESAPPKELVP